MTKFGTLLVSLTCLAATALGDTKPTTPAKPAPAPAPAAAPAAKPAAPAPALAPAAVPAPNAAQVALARETIQAVGLIHQIEAVIGQFRQLAATQSAAIAPTGTATEVQKKAVANMLASLQVLANESASRMLTTYEKAYVDVFSPVELTAIRNFYTSAEGRAFVQKQPELARQMGPSLQQFQEELNRKLAILVQQARQEAGLPATPTAPAPAAATPAPGK